MAEDDKRDRVEKKKIQETVQEEIDRRAEGRETRYFTKEQVIEEMEVAARTYYGRNKRDADPDADRGSYIGLVELWRIVPYVIEKEYQKRFLKRSRVMGWERSANRHFPIKNKFDMARKAIVKAIDDGFIYPMVWERTKFALLVKFPPVGPPPAYFGIGAPSKEEAKKWVERLDRGGLTEEDVEEKQQELLFQKYNSRFKTLAQKKKEAAKEMKEAQAEGQEERYRRAVEKYRDYKQRIEDLRQEIEELRQLRNT
ncbi:MAG: hypothetical protein MUP63_00720 [Candidatus Nanohaloarchaeota archaeon QJJ-7]|nr:hypothetical protein [Candidatus Nanohaloarchaeota archaeon QJJ-7]